MLKKRKSWASILIWCLALSFLINPLSLKGMDPLKEAEVDFWKRTYSLSPEGGLSISDNWRLKSNKDLNRVIFMTLPKPDIPVPGKVFLEADEQVIQLSYDSKLFKADVEIIKISDAILSRSWGNTVYRLTLSAKDKQTKGQYHFKIEALKRKKDMETE